MTARRRRFSVKDAQLILLSPGQAFEHSRRPPIYSTSSVIVRQSQGVEMLWTALNKKRRGIPWRRTADEQANVSAVTDGDGGTCTTATAQGQCDPQTSTSYFAKGGILRPFRLMKYDLSNIRSRYVSDWTLFNQQVLASSIYIFFTNILPGITFASDLHSLTGKSWGTIEVVFSTGLCGLLFSL